MTAAAATITGAAAAVPKRAQNAIQRAGHTIRDLTVDQRHRAVTCEQVKAGLTGKALANWIMRGDCYPPEERLANRVAIAARRVTPPPTPTPNGTVPPPAPASPAAATSRRRYPDNIRAAVHAGCAVSHGKTSTSPGAGDHAHVRDVVTQAIGKDPTADDVIAAIGIDRATLGAISDRSAKPTDADKVTLCEWSSCTRPGTWHRGRHFATIIAVWVDELTQA